MLRNLGFKGLHKKKSNLSGSIEAKIRENNNVQIEDILCDDQVIDELQVKNKSLIKYLDKKEKIKEMIDFIIKDPPEGTGHDRGYKIPWVCSEIFKLGEPSIMKYFLKTNKELEEEKEKNINEEEENKSNDEKEKEKSEEKDIINQNSKKLNINEIVHKKEKENRIELLDYLLTFLSSDKEPNYVLCGYFAAVIKTLLDMEQIVVIKYLYLENKEFIRKLIYHSYRQAISEIVNKIVQYDSNEDAYNLEAMALTRMDILEGLFAKIDLNMDTEKLDSISFLIKNISTDERLLTDMLNNRKIVECLVLRPFHNLKLIIKNNSNEEVILNKRRNFNILIDIIISWINSIINFDIDLPSTAEDENEIDKTNNNNNNIIHTLLSYELFNVLENLIKVNFNKINDADNESKEKKILQCFDEKYLIPLGLYRIKIVDLLGNLFTYFKNIPQLYDKLLINTQFFENALHYLFEYELNNLYQESLLFLFKKFLNYSEDHPLLAEHLFTKLNLMDVIISRLQETDIVENSDENAKKDRFVYESGNTTSRGYIAFLISLSYKINTIIGGDPLRINDTLSREGSISFITRTAPFVGKEEINKFYGMEEDELYEAVSVESKEKTSKLNCAVKSMEKYITDKWNKFFNPHISDKILLYETKLYKDDRRDSNFHNPFILENDDENTEKKQNNFGLGEDEDPFPRKDGLNCEKFLYEDSNNVDGDINFSRFKMSMRLPKKNQNNNILNNHQPQKEKRSSWGKSSTKVLVDEIEIDDDNKKKEEENNEEEEENPLDKFKKEKEANNNNNKETEEEDEDNPLDRFKLGISNKTDTDENDNPLDKFKEEHMNIDTNDNNDLYDNADDEDNLLDKFKNAHKELFDKIEEEEENPLDKFKKENEGIYDSIEGEENNSNNSLNKIKKDGNNIDIYEEMEEEENILDKFKRENKK